MPERSHPPRTSGPGSRLLETLEPIFEIGGLVAAGGSGTVFRATRRADGSDVALKVLDLEGIDATRRWSREVDSLARVRHRRVARLIDYGLMEHGRSAFVATQYVAGPTLDHWLSDCTTLDRVRGVEYVVQSLEGLAAVHGAGLAHRDVKANNIVLDAQREMTSAVLVDFGLAHSYAPDQTPWSRLTGPGGFVGTADYVAPERIEGAAGDARADVWSMGILLHRVLYGYTPFRARTPSLTLVRTVGEPLVSPWRDDASVPVVERALFEVIARALSKDPDLRYPDARAMQLALSGIVGPGLHLELQSRTPGPRDEETKPLS